MNLVQTVNYSKFKSQSIHTRYYDYLYEYFCHYGEEDKVYYLLVVDSGRIRPFSINSIEICTEYCNCKMQRNRKSIKDMLFNKEKYMNQYYQNKIRRRGYYIYGTLKETSENFFLTCCDSFVNELKIYLDVECTIEVYL